MPRVGEAGECEGGRNGASEPVCVKGVTGGAILVCSGT